MTVWLGLVEATGRFGPWCVKVSLLGVNGRKELYSVEIG